LLPPPQGLGQMHGLTAAVMIPVGGTVFGGSLYAKCAWIAGLNEMIMNNSSIFSSLAYLRIGHSTQIDRAEVVMTVNCYV